MPYRNAKPIFSFIIGSRGSSGGQVHTRLTTWTLHQAHGTVWRQARWTASGLSCGLCCSFLPCFSLGFFSSFRCSSLFGSFATGVYCYYPFRQFSPAVGIPQLSQRDPFHSCHSGTRSTAVTAGPIPQLSQRDPGDAHASYADGFCICNTCSAASFNPSHPTALQPPLTPLLSSPTPSHPTALQPPHCSPIQPPLTPLLSRAEKCSENIINNNNILLFIPAGN